MPKSARRQRAKWRLSTSLSGTASTGLSPKFVAEIFDKVKSVNAMGVTVVMIEQNVKEALRIADIVLVLVNGATRLLATPDDILTKHDLHKLYLG